MTNVTPMMKQYFSIKEDHKDALLLFRLGDFYELFYDDAVTAAKVLEITLTTRDKKNNIPMAGVPHHSAKGYIEKLINHGYKVAICEQMEDPKEVKGMVKREVVRIITPGTLIDDFGIDSGESNYILSVYFNNQTYEVSYSDISTGEIYQFDTTDLEVVTSEIRRITPREIVVNSHALESVRDMFYEPPMITVKDTFETHDIELNSDVLNRNAVDLLLSYIETQNMKPLEHLKPVEKYNVHAYLKLNYAALSNLELLENLQTKKQKGSLYWYLNHTETPMGKRRLRRLIEQPLVNKEDIINRQNIVEILLDNFLPREDMKNLLNNVYDIERLVGRMSFGNIDVKGFIQLRDSLEHLPEIETLLIETKLTDNHIFRNFDNMSDIYNTLKVLKDEAPKTIREGEIFKSGVSEELDELREIRDNSRVWLENYLEKERERTGIKNMKIGFNKVFGYFIEISKGQATSFDSDAYGYTRRQTLTNAERYITDELKSMEDKILKSEDESILLEYRMFLELKDMLSEHITRLQIIAEQLAMLDVFISFATVANMYSLVKPEFSDFILELKDSRHPIVEKMSGETNYVPNDVKLDQDTGIYLITGPNMSGKSTYMRQIALIAIMAQMGMFVPASKATVPIFDAIFTRIGASDDLSSGKSTFMIEMMEANEALKHATKDSLLIFDEIGRGTSTYDGMALAEAMLLYIHNKIGSKTLFSTHYHELTELDKRLHRLVNVHVKATEHNGELIFLHKVEYGAVEKSYGIHVAELAGLPLEVIVEARNILSTLEVNETSNVRQLELDLMDNDTSKFDDTNTEILEQIKNLNINELSPLDALMFIDKIKKEMK